MHAQILTTLIELAHMLTALSVLARQVFYASAGFHWPMSALFLLEHDTRGLHTYKAFSECAQLSPADSPVKS